MKNTITKYMILFTIILMDLLTGMEFDLFVPSFPEIQHHFNLTPFWVEALLSVNFFGYCVSLFLVGKLSDLYGRKLIIIFGLLLFIIGSLVCLTEHAFIFLLIGRLLQGIGIAAPAILSFLIIADTYPLQKQQFFMSILNGTMNIAVAIAPVIGSYITLYFHWQGNFTALLLLGLLSLTMTIIFIPPKNIQHKKLTSSSTSLGYKAIIQSRPLMLLIITLLFIFIPYWIFVGMSPLLYIKDLGVSLAHFGYYQGVLALVFAIGSFLFGSIIDRFNHQAMLKISLLIYIVSVATIGAVTVLNNHNPLIITLAFLPFIIGQVIPSNLLYPLSLNQIPEVKGQISALIQGARLVLSALCLQLAGHFYQGSFRNIGIIISVVIVIAVFTLQLVIRNYPQLKSNTP